MSSRTKLVQPLPLSFAPSATFLPPFLPFLDDGEQYWMPNVSRCRLDVPEGRNEDDERGQSCSFDSKLNLPSFASSFQPSVVAQNNMLTPSLLHLRLIGTPQRRRHLPDVLYPCVRPPALPSFSSLRSALARLCECASPKLRDAELTPPLVCFLSLVTVDD